MSYLKLIGLGFVIAIVLVAFAGTASANPLTSPLGTSYTSTIKAESEGTISLDGKFGTVTCKSSFEAKVESHSETTAGGNLSSLTFTECTDPVTVKATGSIEIHDLGTGEAAATSTSAEISISTSGGNCVFTTSSTELGTLMGREVTKGNATLDSNFAAIPRTGGGTSCGPNAVLTGSYKIATPSTLYIGHPTSPLTSPLGTPYTGTIKAEAEGVLKLSGSFTTVECQKSTAEGTVSNHTSTTASGEVASLTFSGCNYSVEVAKKGSLKLDASSGTVTSTGAEVSIATSAGTCIFSTNGTDIGTLTDSSATEGAATLDINSVKIPRTGGNFLCGGSGTWTGSYKVTTPRVLYLGHPSDPASPLTSPLGTSYTGAIKAEADEILKLTGAFVTVECKKSIAEGMVATHTSTTVSGEVASLSFGECNYPVEVVEGGLLKLHTGSGALTSTGAKISIATSVATCVFTTSSTNIGTLTDSSTTEGAATLDINLVSIPRTGGNFLCGSHGTWSGSYKVTTPSTLYLD